MNSGRGTMPFSMGIHFPFRNVPLYVPRAKKEEPQNLVM